MVGLGFISIGPSAQQNVLTAISTVMLEVILIKNNGLGLI